MSCARTTRANTRRSAAGSTRAPSTRWRCSRRCLPARLRPGHALCLRIGAHPQEARHLGDQVEWHHPHDALLGRALCRGRRGLSRHQDRPVPHRHSDRAFCAPSRLVRRCRRSNLFGDILSDLGPACVGSIGIAPSGNINPEREYPSMFEPVHGSAPDIAGRGIANPIGQIWSGAMMLDHFGETAAAQAVERAITEVLADGHTRTPDLGGNAVPRISAPPSPRRSAERRGRGAVTRRRARRRG